MVFNENVTNHHNTWKHEPLEWLHPHKKPIRMQFRGDVEHTHKVELDRIKWTDEKVSLEGRPRQSCWF